MVPVVNDRFNWLLGFFRPPIYNLPINIAYLNFPWRFTVADETKAIISGVFLSFYHLLVDCKQHYLVDGMTA